MRLYLLFCCVFFIGSCKSPDKSPTIDSAAKKNLQKQVTQMADAVFSNDYETIIKFSYPALIEMMGGSDKALEQIEFGIQELKVRGIFVDSISLGQPTIFVNAGEEIHTLIPQTMFLNAPRGIIKSESFIIAITKDKGLNWYFIDSDEVDNNTLGKILPHYNSDLKIPPQTDPVLIQER